MGSSVGVCSMSQAGLVQWRCNALVSWPKIPTLCETARVCSCDSMLVTGTVSWPQTPCFFVERQRSVPVVARWSLGSLIL